MPVIKELFRRHKCEWMAQGTGNYSEEMTREFYVSYAATVRNAIPKREATIRRFIYGPFHTLPINTTEYDYKMGIVQSGAFQRDAKQRERLLR
uniref:Integrase core domain containing protein n=1 Tax=Solanum tuberosum TaxID=4113 RepID=M1E1D8_SOLTU